MPYNPPTPYSVASDSSLTEDYIFTDDILVSQTSAAPLGVFQDSAGDTQALVVTANQVLVHVFADSTSPSGWNVTQVSPDGTAVAQVVAGLHSDNVVYGFFTDGDGNLFSTSLAQGGAWSAPVSQSVQVSGLRATYCGSSFVAYGSDGGSQQALINTGSGYNPVMVPSCYAMAMPGPGIPQPVLIFTGTDFSAGVLVLAQDQESESGPTPPQLLVLPYQNTGTSDDPIYQFDLDEWTNISTYISVPAPTVWLSFLGPGYFLVLDAAGNFSLGSYDVSTSSSSIVDQLATGGNQQVTAIVDSSGLAHLFTVDSTQTLSVIHQTSADLMSGGGFAPPIPLLTDVAIAAVAPNIQQLTSLFTVAQSDGTLYFHQQSALTADLNDPNSGAWTSIQVQQPGQSTGYHVSQYLTELLVLDADGAPVPLAPVTITSDTPSMIAVAGSIYPVSSTQPVSCAADATGSLRLATIAGAVGTTPLTVSSSDLPSKRVWPDQAVQGYLQGLSGLNDKPPLTPETLIQSGLCPAIPASDPNSSATAQQALTTIGLTFHAGSAFTAPAPSSSSTSGALSPSAGVVGFHLDWSDLSKPRLKLFHTEEEFQAHRTALYGSILGGVSHFVGDIYHGLRHLALNVTQWTVHLADATIDFVTKELGALTAIAIRSLDDVVSVVHSIFKALGAAITDVIAFLEALFAWQDIWNTKEVIEHWMTEGFAFLEDLLGQYAKTAVSAFFTNLEGEIADQFSKIQAALGNPTVGSNSSKGPVTHASGSSSAPAPSARGNWMMDKLKGDSSKGLPPLTLQPGSALETALNNLNTTFTNPPDDADWYANLATTFTDAWNALKALAADPSTIASVGISDLIQILQDLVTTAVKAADWLVTLLLELMTALVAAADDILNTPLTKLPLVSFLYSEIIAPNHESLSLQHAMALMAAVPVTLLYKLTHGGTAPFTADQVAQIQSQTFDSSAQLQAARASVQAGSPSPLIGDFLIIVLGIETLSYSVVDLTSQAAALEVPGADIGARLAALFNATLVWTAQVLSWPGAPFTRIPFSSSSISEGERILDALWVANWVPPTLSLGWVGVTWVNETFDEALGATEKVEDLGNSLVSVIGAIREYMAMVGSIWQVANNPSAATIESGLENVIAQLPDSLELLRLSSVVDATDGISVPIKIALNAVCNMSVAGLQAAQTA